MNQLNSIVNRVANKLSLHTTLKQIPSILNPIPPAYELRGLNPDELSDELKEKTEIKDGYTKSEIFQNKELTVYLILWNPNIVSHIHNHGTLGCFYKPLTRGLVEHKYTEMEDYLHYTARKECCPTYTHFINDYVGLHSMENTNEYVCSSIHIYPNKDIEDTN